MQRIEQITGRTPGSIRSIADLNAFFRQCLAEVRVTTPHDLLRRDVITAEHLRCLGGLPEPGFRRPPLRHV